MKISLKLLATSRTKLPEGTQGNNCVLEIPYNRRNDHILDLFEIPNNSSSVVLLNGNSKEKANHETEDVMYACSERGQMVLPCGPNSIRFSPSLNITQQDADAAVEIFSDALFDVERKL
jgi:hypothetical protein